MNLDIDVRDSGLVLTKEMETRFRSALSRAMAMENVPPETNLSLSFVDNEEIRALNRTYRGKDAVTDVLSFPVYEAEEIDALKESGRLDVLGDIVINMDRVRAQATEFGHSLEREMLYLAVHSFLHLLGYDHETEEEKRKMRAREEALMEKIGVSRDKEMITAQTEVRTDRPFHSGYVAVIGRPNVGKSTFINQVMGQKLSIISNRPQTTRNTLQFIYTDAEMQAIFLDTPGVQIPKNELGEAMLKLSRDALDGVDLCLFISDISSRIGPLDRKIIDRLRLIRDVPILMLLNKTDQATTAIVEAEQRRYEELGIFQAVLPISAKAADGIPAVLDMIYRLLPEGPQYFPEEMITDRSERFLITEMIREKCLNLMQDEIPHGIHVGIDQMSLRADGSLYDIYATIYCEKPSHKGMLIGKGGLKLRQIGREARKDIETMLEQHVNLKLWVKVDQNWRRNKGKVKRLGFD